jgi:bacterioferritin (cytochrome b1)
MPRKASPDEPQTLSRPSKMVQVNLRIPVEAREILRQEAPTPKSQGEYVSRLLFAERARMEERQRLAMQDGRNVIALHGANHRQN